MIKRPPKRWERFLESSFKSLLQSPALLFKTMTHSMVPKQAGVYLITVCNEGQEEPYYVGESINLRRRIYTNHFMGSTSNSRFKKYLVGSGECKDAGAAEHLLRQSGHVHWIGESDNRKRKAIESYIKAVLLPKYGFSAEH